MPLKCLMLAPDGVLRRKSAITLNLLKFAKKLAIGISVVSRPNGIDHDFNKTNQCRTFKLYLAGWQKPDQS